MAQTIMEQAGQRRLFPAILLIVFGIIFCGQALGAEFTAVLFSTHPNGEVYPTDTLKPNLWVKGGAYRYEGNYQEKPIIIISNQEIDKAWFLDINRKTYLEVTRSQGGVPDPIQMWNRFFSEQTKEFVGIDTVRGYPCKRYKYTTPDSLYGEKWDSDSLGYFIKLVMHYSKGATTSVEFVGIKEQPVEAGLFVLPEGYVDVKTVPPDTTSSPRRVKIPGK